VIVNEGIVELLSLSKLSDRQQSWGYDDGPWKGPEPPLLVAADSFLLKVVIELIATLGFF
jgi:hypothetical protein